MAITVTSNTTQTFNMDGTTDNGGTWTAIGSATALALNNDIFKVGTGSIAVKLDAGAGTVRGGMQITRTTPVDFDDAGVRKGMVAFWANTTSVPTDVTDTGGITIRMGSDASNYSEWQVSKLNATTEIPSYEGGWQRYVVDLTDAPDSTTGSPTWSATDFFAIQLDTSTDLMGNIVVFFIDQMDHLDASAIASGTKACSITGTVTTSGALFSEINSNTTNIPQGFITNNGGAFQLTQPMSLGSGTGTASDTLTSINETIIIPKTRASDGFIGMTFVGNSTGVNLVRFGTETGTPPASVGSGGGLIKTSGLSNFSLDASNSEVTVEMFGTVIDGASSISWTQTNAKMVSCVITNSGKVSLNNGAEIRDGVITNTIEPSTAGAIELFNAPTDPEFRDMLIQNCNKGIEISTAGTYNMRNIKFAGNTHDLLTNHASGVVTYNVLEGGDTPSNSNTGGGTVTISNPITVTIDISSTDNTPISGVRVYVDLTPVASPSLDQGTTDSNGEFTTIQNLTLPEEINVRARKRGLLPVEVTLTIPSGISSITIPITMSADPVVDRI